VHGCAFLTVLAAPSHGSQFEPATFLLEIGVRYSLANACKLLLWMGITAAPSLQAVDARAQIAANDADATATNSASVASSPSSAASSSAPTMVPRQATERHSAWSTAQEPYIGHGAPQWRYFAEFRARNAASYGHMYVLYGVVNDSHEIIKSDIAGFFPAGDTRNCLNCSVYYWTMGHVVPVPSEIGASDGDLEEAYVLARFRVWIDANQYRNLIAYINERKAHIGPWHAWLANCVTFGRDTARFLNVKMPPLVYLAPTVVMYPKALVESMRMANGLQHEQAPLKDAPGTMAVIAPTNKQARSEAPDKGTSTPASAKKRLANQGTDR
jgi:hypothetical protein